jgi:hypothetical protein
MVEYSLADQPFFHLGAADRPFAAPSGAPRA